MTSRPRPVLILAGDLGAGKTTLINRLLSGTTQRVAIVENEAGEVGIDAQLIDGAADVLDLPDGCACCTMRGALSGALELIAARAHNIDVLIIELSGLADPMPVLQAFHEPVIRAAFGVAALVGVASAAGPVGGGLWRRQLRFADAVVLTKVPEGQDPPQVLCDVVRRITRPSTVLLAPVDATLAHLLQIRGARAVAPIDEGHDHGTEPVPDTVALELDGDIQLEALEAWLEDELVAAGPDLLRVKGIVALAGSRHRYVVQVAYGCRDAYFERPWLGPRRSRIVFIGHHLDRDHLHGGLRACRASDGARA